jgi:hypothetical protein
MADISHLYTVVKNPTTASRTYGYLGAHGKTLAPGASYSQVGSLVDALAQDDMQKSTRRMDSFQRDLLNSKIELISTPRTVLKDATTGAIKTLRLNSTTLGTVDPSWGAYTDS